MRYIFFLVMLVTAAAATAQQIPPTVFEKSKGLQTPEYSQIIDWWKKLDAASPYVKMMEMGPSDAGFPVHLVLISSNKNFDIASAKKNNQLVILFNNGIHPGEPDGIDASMLLAKEVLEQINKKGSSSATTYTNELKPGILLALIPVYNIGGTLNRSTEYRVDQNGPEAFGFRGNSQNLDLNRDFIKCDSKEAFAFTKIFHYLDPDIFVDNHVSDGADYQHVMTLIASQHNKLGGDMGRFMNEQFEPGLYGLMKERGYDLVPYVNHFGDTPDKGWPEFWDSPRYSSGYASLWNTFSFIPETHMLKPYADRVEATKQLMYSFLKFASDHKAEILRLRKAAIEAQRHQSTFTMGWKLDKSRSKEITYLGYKAVYKPSEVSGQPRLFYDRSQPYTLHVPFYDEYTDTLQVTRPAAYLIPQGWWKVVERLQANGIQMRRLAHDTAIQVEWYRIDGYQSGQRPFEGHHLNTNVRVVARKEVVRFRKGYYWIPMDQKGNKFLMQTLEPQGEDSYFTWNFFDPILGQKEGFSDYHFEDVAADYLRSHPEARAALDERRLKDSVFARSGGAQLNFVYQQSPWMEPAYLQYPVFRVL